jgi:hypothetical protein
MLGEQFEFWSFLVGASVDGNVVWERLLEGGGDVSQCGDSRWMGRNWTMTTEFPDGGQHNRDSWYSKPVGVHGEEIPVDSREV